MTQGFATVFLVTFTLSQGTNTISYYNILFMIISYLAMNSFNIGVKIETNACDSFVVVVRFLQRTSINSVFNHYKDVLS